MMGVFVSCPECHSAREYKRDQLGACAECGSLFPRSLREEAGRAVSRKRPVLITVFAVFLSFFAATGTLVLLSVALGSGPYTVNGAPASKEAFMKVMAPFLPIVLTAAVLAYALLRERRWGRPLFLGFYLLIGVAAVAMQYLVRDVVPIEAELTAADLVSGLIMIAGFVGFFGWYFYRKSNVVEYYRVLGNEAP